MGLIIDLFAGGGGASVGIEMALGRHVDIVINHDPAAILMHLLKDLTYSLNVPSTSLNNASYKVLLSRFDFLMVAAILRAMRKVTL